MALPGLESEAQMSTKQFDESSTPSTASTQPQLIDKSNTGTVTRRQSARVNNANNPSSNSETGNNSSNPPSKEQNSNDPLPSTDTAQIELEFDQVKIQRSKNIPLPTTSQPTSRSRRSLTSENSANSAQTSAVPAQETTTKSVATAHSEQQSSPTETSPATDSTAPSSEMSLTPCYKEILLGNDIMSDLRGMLNVLHADIIDLDGDFWVLFGMFEKTGAEVMKRHGMKGPHESHKPLFNLEMEVEGLKDMTIAYGQLSDLDQKKIDHKNTLSQRIDLASKHFADWKGRLTALRIDLEGDAIVQYPTRSEYVIIGNQPNHPSQFYMDKSGQIIQNGTVQLVALAKQKRVVQAIRAGTPVASITSDGISPHATPAVPQMIGVDEASINRITGRNIKRSRHPSTSSLGKCAAIANHLSQSTLKDTFSKLEEENRELKMDKVDLNAKLLLYIKQGNRTSLRTPEVDMLKEENARLSDKVDQLSKEKKILEKENFILKNMGAGSSALGKHTRSSEEELDDVKNKKRKLEREIKELEYRKEDLEDTIKVLEKKTV